MGNVHLREVPYEMKNGDVAACGSMTHRYGINQTTYPLWKGSIFIASLHILVSQEVACNGYVRHKAPEPRGSLPARPRYRLVPG
jgi:hypothetical protein